MSTLRSGELFAGVGGLGMAVDAVFDAEPAWFCEFDAAPSKVLAHHYPDVPNFGDVTKVDWSTAPRVSILAGGFPCQDVSLAGRRRGMGEGTRSGLWSEYAKAIDTLRPDWVVIENVRGLLSADANSNMEPCPLCVGDNPRHVLRALGAVLGDLAELGFDAEWTGIRAADIGAPHGRFRVFILAWPRERTAPDNNCDGRECVGRPVGYVERVSDGRDRAGQTPGKLKLLSTPDTVPDAPNTGSNSHKAGNVVGLGNQVMSLLPTPTASEGEHGGPGRTYGNGTPTLGGIGALLPTPDAYSGSRGGSQHPEKRRDGGHTVSLADVTEHALLGTPRTAQGIMNDLRDPSVIGHPRGRLEDQVALMPTPSVSNSHGNEVNGRGEPLLPGLATEHSLGWGPYAAAIARWEQVIGRPAPAPVRFDGKGGKSRLNPELTEWMMGWPAGHVTDSAIGLSRAEQLKACGNGVVPQQAAAALLEMLARPGVPSIRAAVAA